MGRDSVAGWHGRGPRTALRVDARLLGRMARPGGGGDVRGDQPCLPFAAPAARLPARPRRAHYPGLCPECLAARFDASRPPHPSVARWMAPRWRRDVSGIGGEGEP